MLPFDLNELAAGAVRVIVFPITKAVITTPKLAFAQVAPYAPTSTGVDVGATSGPFTYDRNLTVQSYKVEQSSSVVLETPDELIRQIHVPMAEIRPENVQMFENAAEIGSIAASANASAFQTVAAGSVSDLTAYRVVFVGMRQKQQGAVIEPGGTTRGRFIGAICHRAVMTADSSSVSFGKGNLASMNVTLKLLPEPGQPEGEEQIIWFDETAGTISAS